MMQSRLWSEWMQYKLCHNERLDMIHHIDVSCMYKLQLILVYTFLGIPLSIV